MSAKAGSIGGIILGVVEIVVGAILSIYGGSGVGLILAGVATIAAGAIGLTMPSNTPEAAKASDLKFGNATEGIPIPVVFGEGKVVQNFMNWEASQFYSRAFSAAQGGKGGEQGVGGYNYFLTFEVGICMGEIDELGQVISVPGDILMRGNTYQSINSQIINNDLSASQTSNTVTALTSNNIDIFTQEMADDGAQIIFANGSTATIVTFVDSTHVEVTPVQEITGQSFQIYGTPPQIIFSGVDYQELTLKGNFADQNANGITEGGLIRIYSGNPTQTRIAASDPYVNTATTPNTGFNYRNMCWALFIKYQIGQNTPTPKTYQFVIRRFPKCIRDDNSTVTGLLTRGSTDSTNPAYNQANPAAIIYEILTNTLWGRGISSDFIDETSFIYASTYFASKNLGMSFVMDSPDKLINFLDGIRSHFKTILSWKNGKWTIRCLLDPITVASTIQTLTTNDVEQLQVVRPLWTSTINDLRAQFNSRLKLYKNDTIHVQDTANIELTGRVNSANIALLGFTEWNQAAQQAWRFLRESSYPSLSATFYINRFKSNLEIGDCFRLVWKEWGDATVTAYFDVTRLEPQGKNDDRIKITAIEDSFFCAIAGDEESITLPTELAWEKVVAIQENDLSFFGTVFDENSLNPNGLIFPIIAFEAPAIFTQGKKVLTFIIGEPPSSAVINAQVMANQIINPNDNAPAYKQLKGNPILSIGGALLTAITDTNHPTDRSPLGCFDFSLANASIDEGAILSISQVVNQTDDLETLSNSLSNWFIIDEEIIQVGSVQKISSNHYRAFNVIRGCFGTAIEPHLSSATIFYVFQFADGGYDTTSLGQNIITNFKAYPQTLFGVNPVGNDFQIYHGGSLNGLYLGLGILPLSPSTVSSSIIGTLVQLIIRPRFYNVGVGTGAFIGQYSATKNLTNGEIQDLVLGLEGMTFFCKLFDSTGSLISILNSSAGTFTPDSFGNKAAGTVALSGIPAASNRVAIAAISTLKTDGTVNLSSVTIGTMTYNFVSTLSGSTGEVLESKYRNGVLNIQGSMANLYAAINYSGGKTAGQGVNYNVTRANPLAQAVGSIGVITIDYLHNLFIVSFQIQAVTAGAAGNSIVTTAGTHNSFTGSTMSGGVDAATALSVKKIEVYSRIGQQSSARAAVFTL